MGSSSSPREYGKRQEERRTPAGFGFSLDFGGFYGFSWHSDQGEVEGEDIKSPRNGAELRARSRLSPGASISCSTGDPRNANVGKRGGEAKLAGAAGESRVGFNEVGV